MAELPENGDGVLTRDDWNEITPQESLDQDLADRIVVLIASGVSRKDAVNKFLQVPLSQAYEFYDFWDKVSAEVAEMKLESGEYVAPPTIN